MQYCGTLLAVTDMERSKAFYQQVLGLKIIADFGANVTLSGGVFLQTLDTWCGFIALSKSEVRFGAHAGELYFEEEQMDMFLKKLQQFPELHYVHALLQHPWGQRVVRFYDPDGHLIEVGETMTMVVKRFSDSGMSNQEIAKRMDVPVDYVCTCLSEKRAQEEKT